MPSLRPLLSTATAALLTTALLLPPASATAAPLPATAPPPAVAAASMPPLIVTEVQADNVGDDHFEYFEVHNTTDAVLDLDAEQLTFSYASSDSDDTSTGVDLVLEEPLVLAAGETALVWLSYASADGAVDSYAHTFEEFRSEHAVDAQTQVVRSSGQPGLANSGNRGIRIERDGAYLTRSYYPAGSMAPARSVHFRLPADPAATALAVLAQHADPSPGRLEAETLVPAEPAQPTPEPEPTPLPSPGTGVAAGWPLIITEIAPDSTGYDDFEYVEVYNPTATALDLASMRLEYFYASDTPAVPLTVEGETTIAPGETVVLWLSYASGNVDSFSKTDDDFRAAWNAAGTDFRLQRATGQAGMANGGNRGIRLVGGETVVSASMYSAGSTTAGQTAHFRLPSASGSVTMELLAGAAEASPGVVAPEALADPAFAPQPDPAAVGAPLQITEILPDAATNLNGSDGFEFIELYNASSEPIDFADYAINYVYPATGGETLWPATPGDIVIPAGGTLVLWIKNGGNGELDASAFNEEFGTSLTLGEDLAEISSGGMANSGPRGIELITNTGYVVSSAFFNMDAAVDDVHPDQGIRYVTSTGDVAKQQLLDLQPATPGAVQRDQVPSGLIIVPADTAAPAVDDLTGAEIDPTVDFPLEFRVTDDVQVRTVSVTVRNDVDAEPTSLNLVDTGDAIFGAHIDYADMTGKRWYEYTVRASDGTNHTVMDTRRVTVAGASSEPLRINLDEGQYVGGTAAVAATSEQRAESIELSIDGAPVDTAANLEHAPMFAFEATGVDYYFKNGVRVGEEVLRVFDVGIYTGSGTIATPVPLEHVRQGEELVVSVWAGTKKAPEIDLAENNDDFTVWDLRLILPDGRTLRPIGYDDPALRLAMGDSVNASGGATGKLDFYDARFALPDDAFSARAAEWDTTAVVDGPVEISATDGERAVERTVVVDNTAPTITGLVTAESVDGTTFQGEIVMDPQIEDAGVGAITTVATFDGVRLRALPHTTSSIDLTPGEHTLEVTATDGLGNTVTETETFTTVDEQPGVIGELSPADGDQVEAGDVTLSAVVADPNGDDLARVEFREGRRVDLGDAGVRAQGGTVGDALTTERDGAEPLSAEQLRSITAVDGLAELSSAAAFPYQLFDIEVSEAEADAQVRATWSGRANEGASVMLYALRADGSGWDEVDRHVADSGEAFTLEGVVEAARYRADGAVRLLVQHSEGFAGEDLSDRGTAVEQHHPEDVDRSEYDFTFAWESDTQYYNENTKEGEPYRHQQAIHTYLLDQREDLNLQYLFHTGDIVDDFDQIYQWENAEAEYSRLDDAGLPYGVLAGNHDVGAHLEDYTYFSRYFGEDRFAGNPWHGGSYQDNEGHYDLLSAGGIDFIMLYTGWLPADESIAWMNEVLAQYPDRAAIIAQHEFILTTGGLGEIPQRVMDEVVATNPNVRMVFSGHYHDAETRTDDFDDDGDGVSDRTVYSMLFDYQGLPEGGLGCLRLLHFDNEGERMMVRTYSPSLHDYDAEHEGIDDAMQSFELTYDELRLTPTVRTLGTDAFSAEILSSEVIASFEDVASGTPLSAKWSLTEPGEYGWYVFSEDVFGATDRSPIARFTVVDATTPTPDPGTGEPGTGDPSTGAPGTGDPGAGDPGDGEPDPGTGEPGGESGGEDGGAQPDPSAPGAEQPGGDNGSDELPVTGADAGAVLSWVLAALLLMLAGVAMLVSRLAPARKS
ncbi:lamin tail domain-containing protein [Agrococcus sp. ProA11]|uniref:lamin tail domain-containing protein n=1 Tax=Agrococcus chionoecetis TaxID=3153752 RepID=UPI003260CAA8